MPFLFLPPLPALKDWEAHRIASTTVYRSLHAFDLGIVKDIQNHAAVSIAKTPGVHMTAAQIAGTANQRMKDISKTAKFQRDALFLSSLTESQHSIPGKTRREQCPFLWVSIMGMNTAVDPDKDNLLEAALLASEVQVALNGINVYPVRTQRTAGEIRRIQDICFRLSRKLHEATGLNISTKIHRIMRHVQNQMFSFGSTRVGYTDQNEYMHKTTQKAYRSTDHERLKIAPQLLQSRVRLSVEENDLESRNPGEAQLLLLQGGGQQSVIGEQSAHDNDDERASTTTPQEMKAFLEEMESFVSSMKDPKTVSTKIERMKHPTSMRPLWKSLKSTKIPRKLHWWTDNTETNDTIYASDSFRGGSRQDFVEYHRSGEV